MTPVSFLRDLQFRLEYAALRTIAGAIRALPLDTATRFSARWWRRLAPVLNPTRHKRALANLEIAFPEKTPVEREAICMAHWENLGRVMAETMHIDRIVKDSSRIKIRDAAVFGRYRGKLGPIIGASSLS